MGFGFRHRRCRLLLDKDNRAIRRPTTWRSIGLSTDLLLHYYCRSYLPFSKTKKRLLITKAAVVGWYSRCCVPKDIKEAMVVVRSWPHIAYYRVFQRQRRLFGSSPWSVRGFLLIVRNRFLAFKANKRYSVFIRRFLRPHHF